MDMNYGNIEHTCHYGLTMNAAGYYERAARVLYLPLRLGIWPLQAGGSYTILERPESLRLEIRKGLAEDSEHS